MNIIHHSRQMGPGFDQNRFVPTLEKVTTLVPKPIESSREGALQPMHPFNQVRPRRFHRQMKMIAHDRICEKPPSGLLAGLVQALFERPGRSDGLKDITPVVTTIDHMVDRPFKLQSRFARHSDTVARHDYLNQLNN